MLMLNYDEYIKEMKMSDIKKVIPFILFSYLPQTQHIDVPNVKNNSDNDIFLKSEYSSNIIKLEPGESYNKRIDGIKTQKGVYKVVDYVDELFGIEVNNKDLNINHLPEYINTKLGGGYLKKSPDKNWDSLFKES